MPLGERLKTLWLNGSQFGNSTVVPCETTSRSGTNAFPFCTICGRPPSGGGGAVNDGSVSRKTTSRDGSCPPAAILTMPVMSAALAAVGAAKTADARRAKAARAKCDPFHYRVSIRMSDWP